MAKANGIGRRRALPAIADSAMTKTRLYSIGHSNHDLARLLQLLHSAGVTAVADVRSQPSSQRLPHFSRSQLEEELRGCEIDYAFLGRELGGRPPDIGLYNGEGRVDYQRVRATPAFQRGLDFLCQSLDQFTVAMLCSEEDPLDCHRGLMIAPALVERGIEPAHLRGDGSVESTAEFEDRLLRETGVGCGVLDGLFASMIGDDERAELLAQAYRLQARRKAFRIPQNSPDFSAPASGDMDVAD
jgi:Protein of unknown function, DUF488